MKILLAVFLVAISLAGCFDSNPTTAEPAMPGTVEDLGYDPITARTVVHHANQFVPYTNVTVPMPELAQKYVAERGSGEPTIAVGLNGVAIYPSIEFDAFPGTPGEGALARTLIYRTSDNGDTWEDVTPEALGSGQAASPTSLDPYVYADHATGRMFSVDLYLGCSNLSFTDDDGDSWTVNPVACGVPVNDHQTLFSGPETVQPTVNYGSVLYYCNNQIFDATCAHSLDGGISWVQGAPVFAGFESGQTNEGTEGVCGGLHGHGHASAASGFAYVPKGHCGQAWVAISQDNGLTWDGVLVDNSVGFDGHEAIVSTDEFGNVFYFFLDGDTLPRLSISTDEGYTWSEPYLVGHPNVTAAKFPSIVAGDEGRAAFLYIGSTVDGGFAGTDENYTAATWNAYVGYVFDGLNGTPQVITTTANEMDDPLKRGRCDDRCGGMFDFMDIDINPITGEVWTALVDLCNEECSSDVEAGNIGNRGAVGVQVGGTTLFAQSRE